MQKNLTVLIFMFCLALHVSAQEKNIVPGEVLVQLRSGSSAAAVTDDLSSIGLKPVRLLSDIMNIWLFSYDQDKVALNNVINSLYQSPEVSIAQFNHYVQLRSAAENVIPMNPLSPVIPNDTRFNEQWALNNTGQTGGTPDADIDGPEAWEIAAGGYSGLGDTIVVAIVDGGCELTHSDLDYWINWREIPNNSIDDDGNGYIDDYRGWNAYSNNGSVPANSHGTHVSGIAGAKGNNSLGVAGVNWIVKTMPVAASSSSEATVIAGYGYVLKMRHLYNQTNGQQGAFVVATNASFGVDYGQPSNYPLWCAIYDSMGVRGIISCGATANLNINVDVSGDIPTACPSPYLISVTNTTNTDNKNSGAAYGLTTIDLGAPGTSVLSTYTGNGYSSLTGTSMATPHVTGVVALMVSAANSILINQYKSDPAIAALNFKNLLLENTDSVVSLQGKTVTGGRLNAYKAVIAVAAAPDTIPPGEISDLAVTDTTSGSLTLNWTVPADSSLGGVMSYDIRMSSLPITPGNFSTAQQVIFPGAPSTAGSTEIFEIPGLSPAAQYYFAVKSKDRWGNASPVSNIVSGTTYQAPQVAVTPASISKVLTQSVVMKDTVRISNVTPYISTLDFLVRYENNTFPTGYVTANIIPGNAGGTYTDKDKPVTEPGYAYRGSGGPDYFGYKWIDSNEPSGPQYIWEDISITGTMFGTWTPVSTTWGGKDEGYAGPVNFNFKFYGIQNTQVYVNSNGFLTFAAPTSTSYGNTSIPSSAFPNGYIAPFWDDLDGTTHGEAYYKIDGTRLIIQYEDWSRYSSSSDHLTFQVVLYSSGKIMYYYKTMTGTINSATIGIEDQAGSGGLPVAYNAAYVQNNLAVKIQAEPDWVTGAALSGTLYNGNTALVELTFRTEDYPLGNYSLDMLITSNDPVNDSIVVPVSLTIVEIPVELTSFSASAERNNVVLKWSSATETNNESFRIERALADPGTKAEYEEAGYIKGYGTTTEKTGYSFTDKNLQPAKYYYRLKQVDYSGEYSYSPVVEVDLTMPYEYTLYQNYPNPFNPATTIEYALPEKSDVRITVYSILGDKVMDLVNSTEEAGYKKVVFDASGISSGIYFYTISAKSESGVFRSSRKMVIMK